MAVSRAMRRLLHVLEIQEEECRAAMESARAELKRTGTALTWNVERERGGRRLVAASAATGEIADRIAGIEETRVAKRFALALSRALRNRNRPLICGSASSSASASNAGRLRRLSRRRKPWSALKQGGVRNGISMTGF